MQSLHNGHSDHRPPPVLPFERKVERWASALAQSLVGTPAPFVLTLGPDGSTRSVSFEHPATSWFARTTALAEAGVSFLFYDPLGGDGRAFIAWSGVERVTLERLLGAPLADTDFVGDSREMPDAFPAAWDAVIDEAHA